ncbi:hypothetical protein U9M48_005773 [Paspalum notatum var. saurae]|uniref:Nitrate transporter n=1 Tax=Paspalum notatum var. saurae TaxID=547442 RepID=A0AAQ3PQW1_PASNO
MGVLYLGLYLTALGTGGLKSSVSGFGSDQFDDSDAGERRRMARFFNWFFFFFISIGSLLAVTVLVYVQDHLGRPWGYGACLAAILLLGLSLFLAGTPRYRFKKLHLQPAGGGKEPAGADRGSHGGGVEEQSAADAVRRRPDHHAVRRRQGREDDDKPKAAAVQGIQAKFLDRAALDGRAR